MKDVLWSRRSETLRAVRPKTKAERQKGGNRYINMEIVVILVKE
jgi:hypothetical protein